MPNGSKRALRDKRSIGNLQRQTPLYIENKYAGMRAGGLPEPGDGGDRYNSYSVLVQQILCFSPPIGGREESEDFAKT